MVIGETSRKRKATGQHQPVPSPPRGEFRTRSPPPYPPPTSLSIPPSSQRGRHRHTRQQSDISPFRSPGLGQVRRESFGGVLGSTSPIRRHRPGAEEEGGLGSGSALGTASKPVAGERIDDQRPTVSSMLSREPQTPSRQGEGRRPQSTPPGGSLAQARAGVERTPSSSRDESRHD